MDTKSLDAAEEGTEQLGLNAAGLADITEQGIATFETGASLRLDIQGSTDPIIFKPKAETIFGRRDPATGAMPDVDLTPFAGYRMGVSRRHAAIRSGENQSLDLWDLGSSNGTYLNEERLNPHRPYRLRDGDEIRLGSMGIRIYFQRDDKPSSRPDSGEQPARPTGLPPVSSVPEPYAGPPRPKTLPADSSMLASILSPNPETSTTVDEQAPASDVKPASPEPESTGEDTSLVATESPEKPASSGEKPGAQPAKESAVRPDDEPLPAEPPVAEPPPESPNP